MCRPSNMILASCLVGTLIGALRLAFKRHQSNVCHQSLVSALFSDLPPSLMAFPFKN